MSTARSAGTSTPLEPTSPRHSASADSFGSSRSADGDSLAASGLLARACAIARHSVSSQCDHLARPDESIPATTSSSVGRRDDGVTSRSRARVARRASSRSMSRPNSAAKPDPVLGTRGYRRGRLTRRGRRDRRRLLERRTTAGRRRRPAFRRRPPTSATDSPTRRSFTRRILRRRGGGTGRYSRNSTCRPNSTTTHIDDSPRSSRSTSPDRRRDAASGRDGRAGASPVRDSRGTVRDARRLRRRARRRRPRAARDRASRSHSVTTPARRTRRVARARRRRPRGLLGGDDGPVRGCSSLASTPTRTSTTVAADGGATARRLSVTGTGGAGRHRRRSRRGRDAGDRASVDSTVSPRQRWPPWRAASRSAATEHGTDTRRTTRGSTRDATRTSSSRRSGRRCMRRATTRNGARRGSVSSAAVDRPDNTDSMTTTVEDDHHRDAPSSARRPAASRPPSTITW